MRATEDASTVRMAPSARAMSEAWWRTGRDGPSREYAERWTAAAPEIQESGTSANCAAAARSGYIVRSPEPSTMRTIVPVRPCRWTLASTPAVASSRTSASPIASSPTRPMKRTAVPRLLAKAATLEADPPRVRRIRAGLSVPDHGTPSDQTTTSSTRSPIHTRAPLTEPRYGTWLTGSIAGTTLWPPLTPAVSSASSAYPLTCCQRQPPGRLSQIGRLSGPHR